MFRSGRKGRSFILVPLLALIFAAPAAVQPPSYEKVWQDSRAAMDRGQLAEALKIVDDALARAGKSNDEAVWALRVQRATLLGQTGGSDEAAKILAQPLPAKLSGSAVAVRRLITLAMLAWNSGDARSGRAQIENARVIAARTAPDALAEVLFVRGLLGKDEADVKTAIRLANARSDKATAAKAEANLVLTYADTNRFAEAVSLGEGLLPRMAAIGLDRPRAITAGNVGWVLLELGDHERALELLSKAAVDFGRMGDLNSQLIFLTTLGNVHISRRDWPAAIRDSQRVVDMTVGMKHRSRGHAFSHLARIYLELGRFAEAREAVRQALELESGNDKLITRVVEARIRIAEGAHDEATRSLLEIVGTTADKNIKLMAQGQLARAYAAAKQNQPAERAFRGAVTLVRDARDSISSKEARLTFFNTASELFDNYVDFLIATGREDDALLVTETSRAQTLAEGLDLHKPETLDPRKLARQHNATILCYWLGRHRSYVWTITPTDIRLTTLKPDTEIEKEVGDYGARLITTAGTLERSGGRGQQLFNLLVAKAAAGLPQNARVIVVPDGRLHTLNFETLVTPAKTYWIEDVVLANASSLQLLARAGAAARKTPNLLLVGNPPQADPAFPVLEKAGDEIQRISKRFPGRATILAGPRATPAAYKAAKPAGYDFVHFVAHGAAARTRPLDSAVILGLDANRDYRLQARDIANQPLEARLVTISSCHGAGTTTYAGEGLVGLAWAFLHAGAQQVVAALWAVKDSAAPKLMDDLYAGIRAGRDPAVALRDAKLGLLRSKTSYQHARYWAPFVIYQ